MIRLALRNLRLHLGRSVLTGGGTAVAVIVLSFYLAFMDGVTAHMIGRTTRLSTGDLQIHSDVPMSENLYTRLRVAGVEHISPRIRFEGLLGNGEWAVSVFGLGFDPKREYAVCPEKRTVQSPAAFSDGLSLTPQLWKNLASRTSLTLSATNERGRENAVWLEQRSQLSLDVPFINNRLVWITLADAQSLLSMPGAVNEWAMTLKEGADLLAVAAALRHELGNAYRVSTWIEREPMAKQFIDRFRAISFFITLCLVILVSAAVANSTLMSVSERSRELGTMLAVGMRRRQLMRMIAVETLALATIAAFAGVLVGGGAVAYFAHAGLPITSPGMPPALVYPHFTWWSPTAGVLLAEGTAVLAAIAPALRVSRLSPVEALRQI